MLQCPEKEKKQNPPEPSSGCTNVIPACKDPERLYEENKHQKKKQISKKCNTTKSHERCLMVTSQQDKTLALEQHCKHIQEAFQKLQKDVEVSIEHLKEALEECQEEKQRLLSFNSKVTKRRILVKHTLQTRKESMLNTRILWLTKSNKKLKKELSYVKSCLNQIQCNIPASSTSRIDYAGWSREWLILQIKLLEKNQYGQMLKGSAKDKKKKLLEECKIMTKWQKMLNTEVLKFKILHTQMEKKMRDLKAESNQVQNSALSSYSGADYASQSQEQLIKEPEKKAEKNPQKNYGSHDLEEKEECKHLNGEDHQNEVQMQLGKEDVSSFIPERKKLC